MGSRKLVRDFFLSRQISFRNLQSQSQSHQALNARLRPVLANGIPGSRQFSVFNEFSKKVKGEVKSNEDFQQSIKELKEKADELKEVKEGLKARTKQTTEQLYKSMDGVWTEAEATVKKVSADVKEKISAATEEVKETFRLGKEESSESTDTNNSGADINDRSHTTSRSESSQKSESNDTKGMPDASDTLFGRFRSSVSSSSPKISLAFQKLKDAKVVDLAKKGYDIVKDELSSSPSRRRRMRYAAASSPKEARSTKTDIVVVPTKESIWKKKWDAFKEKMQGHPAFKRISGISEPVVTKGQELAEDMRERWETSDHPVVHKIQDLNETVFGETDTALSFKEIRRRDPSFSLPEFVAEVQEMIRPTLNAYLKGDVEALKKNCSPEVIERCRAEHRAYESQGIFFDNKILHISEVDVRETKMMGTSPIIIVAFQTQQVYCVRDRHGSVTEGGKDTIHTVYYAWAMQQVDDEELGGEEVSLYPIWRLREMQQLGIKALI
ncbi:mitochondrial import inner membrane translocase subunit TIM44-2 [Cinnamomum micranthum f. kanehirae]|uniref:Mitochondrial import inner membrane translocase subunit TIM44-2 n=1 Tax=Cinnamomum micranthum f. kanehirae TaxID=337451 RepID=A0A3S3NQF5_9MAGN|nr:mitochondrial import inner membrane translocase subunit TIM44-2 [Cinnamomum micranthum f. kanehirae]